MLYYTVCIIQFNDKSLNCVILVTNPLNFLTHPKLQNSIPQSMEEMIGQKSLSAHLSSSSIFYPPFPRAPTMCQAAVSIKGDMQSLPLRISPCMGCTGVRGLSSLSSWGKFEQGCEAQVFDVDGISLG